MRHFYFIVQRSAPIVITYCDGRMRDSHRLFMMMEVRCILMLDTRLGDAILVISGNHLRRHQNIVRRIDGIQGCMRVSNDPFWSGTSLRSISGPVVAANTLEDPWMGAVWR